MKGYLKKLSKNPSSSRSLLFAGNDKKLKEEESINFAKALLDDHGKVDLGIHPDLHILKPEGKIGLHSIASIRRLIDEVYLPPTEAPCKVFVIFDADRMLPTSANALLKTFEEPAERTFIILLAPSPRNLLPTIVSRCQTLYFPQIHISEEKDQIEDKILSLLVTRRNYTDFLQEIKAIASEIESVAISDDAEKTLYISGKVVNILNTFLKWYRDVYLVVFSGDRALLFFKDKIEELEQFAKRKLLPLSKVEKILQESKSLLNRSVPIAIILENTLLKLG